MRYNTSLMFSENIGYNGGALALIDNSFIKLKVPFNIQFLKNHAKHCGGAIYVNDYVVNVFNKGGLPKCFFQVEGQAIILEQISSLTLENNTAQFAGSALYGGWVDLCEPYTGRLYENIHSTELFDASFQSTMTSMIYQW